MLDTGRPALLTDKLLDVIMPELNREPRSQDNVWCVIDAIACVVAGPPLCRLTRFIQRPLAAVTRRRDRSVMLAFEEFRVERRHKED